MAHPDDSAALQELYSQGMRNHLGAYFHEALTTYKGEPEVLQLLKDYEKAVAQWHKPMQGNGASTVANDPTQRKQFIEDMQDAMKIAVRILGVTRPKR